MNKPTFKKEPRETGLAGMGHPYPNTQIKFHKKECGWIQAPNYMSKDNLWRIYLHVIKENSIHFQNILLKAKFPTEEECRKWLVENWDKILEKFTLHYIED